MARLQRLITFDVTGTLLEFRSPVPVLYSECAKKFNIVANPDIISTNFKVQMKRMLSQHPNFGKNTGLGWKRWWTEVVVHAFSPAVPDASNAQLERVAEYLIQEFSTDRCLKLVDGAADVLQLLKKHNVLLGIVSNYDERLEAVLKSVQIHSYFDVVVSSYRAGVMKPDRRIFDFVLKEINSNKLSPENCLHIGNSVELDYIGAHNAGWQAFLVGTPSTTQMNAVSKSHVFQDLYQLRHYFQSSIII